MKPGSLTLPSMLSLLGLTDFGFHHPKSPPTHGKHLIPKAAWKGTLPPNTVEVLQFRWDPSLSLTQLSLDLEKWWGQSLKDSPSLPLLPYCFPALDLELPNTGHTAERTQDMLRLRAHFYTQPWSSIQSQQSLRVNHGPHNGLGTGLAMVAKWHDPALCKITN